MTKVSTKPTQTMSKKRYWLSLSILLSSAIVSGIVLGVLYLAFFYQPPMTYGKEDELRDNEADIYAKYKDTAITDLDGVTAFIVAEYKSNLQNTMTLHANGTIVTDMPSMTQTMYTTRYLDHTRGLYYVENISKGKVILGVDTNIAERNFYNQNTDILTVYQGTNTQETSATFNMDKANQTMTLAAWKQKNGTTPVSFQPYIVSSQTVIKATTPQACTLDDGSSGYHFTLTLNKDAAAVYVLQIKNLSKLGDNPSFDSISVEVYLNADGTFHEIIGKDHYYVRKMGLDVGTSSILDYHFSYNDDIIFPDNIDKEDA